MTVGVKRKAAGKVGRLGDEVAELRREVREAARRGGLRRRPGGGRELGSDSGKGSGKGAGTAQDARERARAAAAEAVDVVQRLLLAAVSERGATKAARLKLAVLRRREEGSHAARRAELRAYEEQVAALAERNAREEAAAEVRAARARERQAAELRREMRALREAAEGEERALAAARVRHSSLLGERASGRAARTAALARRLARRAEATRRGMEVRLERGERRLRREHREALDGAGREADADVERLERQQESSLRAGREFFEQLARPQADAFRALRREAALRREEALEAERRLAEAAARLEAREDDAAEARARVAALAGRAREHARVRARAREAAARALVAEDAARAAAEEQEVLLRSLARVCDERDEAAARFADVLAHVTAAREQGDAAVAARVAGAIEQYGGGGGGAPE